MAKYTIRDTILLPQASVKIPRLGFGVYRAPRDLTVSAVTAALKAGYRHVDTAQMYGNEKEVGEAIRNSGIPREEIFVTTKIRSPVGSVSESYASMKASVDSIGVGYVDLFLIHAPNSGSSGRKELWTALEKLAEDGLSRTIGVSNYGVKHLEEMKEYAKAYPPAINQIELHPWFQQRDIVSYCQKEGIAVEAYCPIARNEKADDTTLKSLADKYGKLTTQVLIRYCLQKGWIPLPKSEKAERISTNADVYGFDISDEDMSTLDGLDDPKGNVAWTPQLTWP